MSDKRKKKPNESGNGLTVALLLHAVPRGGGGWGGNTVTLIKVGPYITDCRTQVWELHLGFEFSDSTINWQSDLLPSYRLLPRNHVTAVSTSTKNQTTFFRRPYFSHKKDKLCWVFWAFLEEKPICKHNSIISNLAEGNFSKLI